MKWQFKFDEFIDKYKTVISLVLIAIILISSGFLLFSARKTGGVTINGGGDKGGQTCKVDVEGAVKNPGVYNLKPEDRVEDAIRAAGGIISGADLSKVSKSLSAKVVDEERIMVPFSSGSTVTESASSGSTTSSGSASPQGLVNINTASLSELDTLPGIGPATAQKIIDYREANGSFGSIEDIINVSGIGQAKFDKIKNMITI